MGAEIVDHGWKQIQKNIRILKSKNIKVGVLGKSDSELLMYAAVNEFGLGHVPSRPFMRQTFEEHEKDMINRIAAAYKAVEEGADVYKELTKTGLYYQGLIQKMFVTGDFKENADETIAAKGHSRPLIGGYKKRKQGRYIKGGGGKREAPKPGETGGRLRQSISYEVT